MNQKKVFVTGANGFTGPYMAKALKKAGLSVIGSSLSGERKGSEFDEFVSLDITNQEQASIVMSNIKPDYVIHLAAISFVGHANASDFYNINVIGTENLLNALVESSCEVENILIASSANIYGTPTDIRVIDESVSPSPVNHYANSKLAMEFTAKANMAKLPITIARPFNYIGFGQNESFVVPKIIKAYANKLSQLELGAINVSRDFSSVYDTTEAYVKLLLNSECVGQVFNVCTGLATNLSEILEIMNEVSGYKMNIVTNPKFVRKNEIPYLCGSNAKIREYTDWTPSRKLKDILEEIYDQYSDRV